MKVIVNERVMVFHRCRASRSRIELASASDEFNTGFIGIIDASGDMK